MVREVSVSVRVERFDLDRYMQVGGNPFHASRALRSNFLMQ